MLLTALRDEVERNIEAASSTKRMIDRERDMLQGDLQERVSLQRFHTDIWDSLIAGGSLQEYGDVLDTVAAAYRDVREYNQVVDQFDRHGNNIVHSPLITGTMSGYGRKETIEIIREKCDEAEVDLRDAREALEDIIRRTCSVCGELFPSRGAMKSHRSQKDDSDHRAARDGR